MLQRFKEWAKKIKEDSYSKYVSAKHEYDCDFYQGRFSCCLELLKFIEELEQEYKDDFK